MKRISYCGIPYFSYHMDPREYDDILNFENGFGLLGN